MALTRRDFVASTTALAAASGLSAVARAAGTGTPDVIVLGAGLSGLETAVTLEENGLKTLVLEGRQRVGGRVYTLFDIPGHPEVGFNSLSNAYGRGIAASKKYGVELENLAPRVFGKPIGQAIFVAGRPVDLKTWADDPRNPFEGELRRLPPAGWADEMFKRHMPFKDLENWYDPKYSQYDISVHDFLAQHGASEAAIRLGYDTNIAYGTTANDVSLLMQAFSDYWQNVNRGAIMGFSRTGAAAGAAPGAPPAAALPPTPPGAAPQGGAAAAPPAGMRSAGGVPPGLLLGAYKGGNERLPQAMAKRVKGDLLLGKRVVAIEVSASGAKVTCADGSTYSAKAVVCSLPFTTLRHVRIDPLPGAVQRKAIQTLGSIPITQFHMVAKQPFWDSDGLPASMWTDGPLGMILAQRGGASDTEITSLTCWTRGLAAQFVDRLPPEEAKRFILAELAKLRPASKGLVTVAAMHSWAQDPFAAGDWAIYEPGQVRAFQATLAQPHQRMFFCGEHTSVGSRGLEGALESAERVALEVLTAIA
jgi:monoamine oxidase